MPWALTRCPPSVPRWLNPWFPEITIRETEKTRIIQNSNGLLAEIPKDGHATIPHYLESSIKNPDDWRRCKEERLRRDDPARKVDVAGLKSRMRTTGRDFPLAVFAGSMIGQVRDLLTLEGLAYAIYDYPEMVEDMVETCCVLVEDFLDQALPEFDFDLASGWEDICYNRGPLVSLDFFEHVIVPRYQRISAKLRKFNIDVFFTDCDGDLRPIIPHLLKGGINTLFPFEVNGCGNPVDVLRQYEGQLRIMGGVDKMVLAQGPVATRAFLEKLVPWVEKAASFRFATIAVRPMSPRPITSPISTSKRTFRDALGGRLDSIYGRRRLPFPAGSATAGHSRLRGAQAGGPGFREGLPAYRRARSPRNESARSPIRLKESLGNKIAEVEARHQPDAVALVYGLCGCGLIGVRAQKCPGSWHAPRLRHALPRQQGTLSSKTKDHPETYWYTPGWNKTERAPSPEKFERLDASSPRNSTRKKPNI